MPPQLCEKLRQICLAREPERNGGVAGNSHHHHNESHLLSRSTTTLEAKPFINGNRHVILWIVECKNHLDPLQSCIAHETNRALRHPKIKGFLRVIGPIRNTLIINPRLCISQKRFHNKKIKTPKLTVMSLTKEMLLLSGVWTHYRARVDPKIPSKIQKVSFEFFRNPAFSLIAPKREYLILITFLCNSAR
jgi:hypothetical protein